MKKLLKLIPAIILLVISILLSTTATFAWFSMNTRVSATGMQIQAEVPAQLLIKGSATAAEYKSNVDFTLSADSAQYTTNTLFSVPPVAYRSSTSSTSVPSTFYKLTTLAHVNVKTNGYLRDIYDETGSAIINYTDFTKVYLDDAHTIPAFRVATAHEDYLMDTFSLKYAGEYVDSYNDVKVDITVTTSATVTDGTVASDLTLADISPIYQAVHIVFVQGADAYEVDLGSAVIDTADSSVSGTTATVVLKVADVPLKSFTESNQEYAYTMYIYYDGEDAQCINDNAINMASLNFNMTFDLYNVVP